MFAQGGRRPTGVPPGQGDSGPGPGASGGRSGGAKPTVGKGIAS
jgi:hypothetical protein